MNATPTTIVTWTATLFFTVWTAINIAVSYTLNKKVKRFEMISKAEAYEISCNATEVDKRAALLGTTIQLLISRNGIERTLEDLKECGYQISPDDRSETHYTLYDNMGYTIELDFENER